LSEKDYRAILEAKVQQAMRKPSFRQHFRQRFGALKASAVDSSALLEFLQTVVEANTKNPYASLAQFQSPWAQCVRKMQSSRLKWKLQWDAFVESNAHGMRDPSRHPPEVLIAFLNEVSPPCPNPMLKEFGLSPQALQLKEVNPHLGALSPPTPSTDPESIEFIEAPLNMQCSSMGKSQAVVPAKAPAESKATVRLNEGQRLKHGARQGRAASWPPSRPPCTETHTSYALSFRVRNTFLVFACDP
jgi:malate synthase